MASRPKPRITKPKPTATPLSASALIVRRPFNLAYGGGRSPAPSTSVSQPGGPAAPLKIKAD